jgi:hypothetical protein
MPVEAIPFRDIVAICDRYGVNPDTVTTNGWEGMVIRVRVPGIDVSLTAKTLDEFEARVRLLAPLLAEVALAKKAAQP